MATTPLDLTTRAENAAAISATLYDATLTAIQTAVNAIYTRLDALEAELAYGEMYIASDQTVTVASAGTYVKVGDFTSGHLDILTFDATTDSLVATQAGDYLVSASFSISGVNATTYRVRFAVDGTTVADHECSRKTSSTDVAAAALTGILTLTAGQKVSLMITGDNTGDTSFKAGTTLVMLRRH